jgi:hypothetical protein
MTTATEQLNYWQEFWATLKERLCKPCKHPTFVMYFIGIIIVVGSLGLLEPIVSCWVIGSLPSKDLPRALVSATYTYFVAIAATAAVDFVLSYYQRKHLLMFFVLCSLAVLTCFLGAVIYGTFLHRPDLAAFPALLGYLLALFLWWIGNAENAHLLDTPIKPTSPIGDDYAEPTGDLTGFNT